MFEFAGSFASGLAALVLYIGPFLLAAYLFLRGARRVAQHMDRVELELVTVNRQLAELGEALTIGYGPADRD